LGLTQMDSKVYLFLAKRGLQQARDISKSLKMNKQQLYRSLTNLQSKGIVSATLEHPARFSAIPFEKVLDLYVRTKTEEAQSIQQNKDAILSVWRSIAVGDTDAAARFMVIEGRNVIYSKIQQMIQETRKQLSVISTVPSLVRADQFGLFDVGSEHPSKSKIQFNFLTNLSEQNVDAMKSLLKEMANAKINLEARAPDLGLNLFPRMLIRDEEEAMFFITSKTEAPSTEQDDACLWTNCKALVQAFTAVFEDIWRNATDIQRKIDEIETGKQPVTTNIITDEQTAQKRYEEIANAAEKEIVIMTSSKGLMSTWRDMRFLKERSKKGVAVRIMAPIMSENLEAARKLSEYSEVRHVPESYQETALIDGKHLFQFKPPSTEREKLEPTTTPYFEDSSYTDDHEYVEKTRIMLDDIWKGASAIPDAVKNEAPIETGTGTRILDEIIVEGKMHYNYAFRDETGKRLSIPPDATWICRGTMAQAVIYPPSYLKMPNFGMTAIHYDEPSDLRGLNNLIVSLWLQTPSGFSFIPTAIVTTSPIINYLKMLYGGTPAEQNIIVVKPHELEVYNKGSTLFAGWTIEVPLLPPKHLLPAGCLLFEGYGVSKRGKDTFVHRSGSKTTMEADFFNAFVTLMSPNEKIERPATQGRILTKCTMTTGRLSN
jgi:sugar-specific transcriptional regulator TrmB